MARFHFDYAYKEGPCFSAETLTMKIAFIGTHGTGKTTLCHLLTGEMKKRGLNAHMVTEIARKCPLPINQQTNADAQLWILVNQIGAELETAHRHDYVICDRSVLDNYAYQVVNSGEHALMGAIVEGWLPTYDVLFKTPNCLGLEADGVRATERSFQDAVDGEVDRLLAERGVAYVALPEEPGQQLAFVLDYLGLS